MDVARALYQDMTGQPVTPASTPEGRKWMVEDGDLFSSFRYWWDGNLTIKDWLSSVHGVEETAFISRDDPLPFAAACIMDVKHAWAKTIGSRRSQMRAQPWGYGSSDGAPELDQLRHG
jgi:predicted ATP-grasp superfamily ATP-dependent carboligase